MDDDFTLQVVDGVVRFTIAGEDDDFDTGLEMTADQARQLAFALMDLADDLDPPAWRKP